MIYFPILMFKLIVVRKTKSLIRFFFFFFQITSKDKYIEGWGHLEVLVVHRQDFFKHPYHQDETLIDFWFRLDLNPKSFTRYQDTLLVELILKLTIYGQVSHTS